MTDTQILEHIGLTDQQLSQLLAKFNDFVKGLSEPERRAFLRSLKSAKTAAADLDEGVTAQHLEEFLKKHGPPHGVICYMCDEDL